MMRKLRMIGPNTMSADEVFATLSTAKTVQIYCDNDLYESRLRFQHQHQVALAMEPWELGEWLDENCGGGVEVKAIRDESERSSGVLRKGSTTIVGGTLVQHPNGFTSIVGGTVMTTYYSPTFDPAWEKKWIYRLAFAQVEDSVLFKLRWC